jgi:hypothetical protein
VPEREADAVLGETVATTVTLAFPTPGETAIQGSVESAVHQQPNVVVRVMGIVAPDAAAESLVGVTV